MLNDVRILDLSHLLPGQYATALLAQLGADVVMIERPGGHKSRDYPTSYTMYNHSKRSVVLDLKDDDGREAFLALAADADVVVEQFRPGVVSRLGIDHDAVSAVNPNVVYCSISGYGQDGPRAADVGHDLNYISLAGILDQTGERDGPPVPPGVPIADLSSSVFAALSMAAALRRDGGEYVDVSMADAAVNMASNNLAEFFGRGYAPARGERLINGGYPYYSVYECADGEYVSLGAVEPHFWEAFCDRVDRPEWIDRQHARGEEREELSSAVAELFRTRPAEEWVVDLDSTVVPISIVQSLDEVPEDDHVQHRNLVRDVQYDSADKNTKTVGYPASFGEYKSTVERAPDYGEHTRELLTAAGYDDETVTSLADRGVIDE